MGLVSCLEYFNWRSMQYTTLNPPPSLNHCFQLLMNNVEILIIIFFFFFWVSVKFIDTKVREAFIIYFNKFAIISIARTPQCNIFCPLQTRLGFVPSNSPFSFSAIAHQ